MLSCRCFFCDRPFQSETDDDVCDRCEAQEGRTYRRVTLAEIPIADRSYSKGAMRERLSVSGNEDE